MADLETRKQELLDSITELADDRSLSAEERIEALEEIKDHTVRTQDGIEPAFESDYEDEDGG